MEVYIEQNYADTRAFISEHPFGANARDEYDQPSTSSEGHPDALVEDLDEDLDEDLEELDEIEPTGQEATGKGRPRVN